MIEAAKTGRVGQKNVSERPEFLPGIACAIITHGVIFAHGNRMCNRDDRALEMQFVWVQVAPQEHNEVGGRAEVSESGMQGEVEPI